MKTKMKTALLALLFAGTAAAQPPADPKKEASDLLKKSQELKSEKKDLEDVQLPNLVRKKEAVKQKEAQLDQERTAYERAFTSACSYCTGTFEEPEYSRRLAWCNNRDAELKVIREDIAARNNVIVNEQIDLQTEMAQKAVRLDEIDTEIRQIDARLLELSKWTGTSKCGDYPFNGGEEEQAEYWQCLFDDKESAPVLAIENEPVYLKSPHDQKAHLQKVFTGKPRPKGLKIKEPPPPGR